MLRVGLDTSALALTKAGTARYVTNLCNGLEQEPSIEVSKLSWGNDNRVTKVARDMFWYPSGLNRAAKEAGAELLHCPTMRAPPRSKIPLVVTIHDVAVLRYPEAFNGWTRRYSARTLPRVVRAANGIVVVSAFSRDELLELLPVDESKVRVIPHGVGPPFTPEGPAADGDYVLAVSTLEPRKNFDRLVEGFRQSGFDGLELRVVGAEGWGGVEVDGERVRHVEGVDDDELARLYRGAVAVVYVSLYEGFGLPVLEAMACGTPVVAPAGRPYDEFSHGIAFEVDPLDVDSIAAGIQRAVASGSQPVGVRRAADFTWERTVRSHVELYKELAG